MARSRPSFGLMIAVLLAVAAAAWAVSVRTRPAFAVYDSVPPAPPARKAGPAAPSSAAPADGTPPAAVTPLSADSPSSLARVPQPLRHPRISASVGLRPDSSPAAVRSPTDSARGSDTLRHHRSENYGGYSGYGSRERRGTPNAR